MQIPKEPPSHYIASLATIVVVLSIVECSHSVCPAGQLFGARRVNCCLLSRYFLTSITEELAGKEKECLLCNQ